MLRHFQPFIDYAKLIEIQANTFVDKVQSKRMKKITFSKAKIKRLRIRTTNK